MCTKRSSIGIEAPEYPYTEGLLLQQLFMKLLLLCPTTAVAALASCVLLCALPCPRYRLPEAGMRNN